MLNVFESFSNVINYFQVVVSVYKSRQCPAHKTKTSLAHRCTTSTGKSDDSVERWDMPHDREYNSSVAVRCHSTASAHASVGMLLGS